MESEEALQVGLIFERGLIVRCNWCIFVVVQIATVEWAIKVGVPLIYRRRSAENFAVHLRFASRLRFPLQIEGNQNTNNIFCPTSNKSVCLLGLIQKRKVSVLEQTVAPIPTSRTLACASRCCTALPDLWLCSALHLSPLLCPHPHPPSVIHVAVTSHRNASHSLSTASLRLATARTTRPRGRLPPSPPVL